MAITRDGRATLSLRHQLEQDFEVASNEYDYINTAMKQDMPRFMVLATRFIDPLFHSFFYMQCVFSPPARVSSPVPSRRSDRRAG